MVTPEGEAEARLTAMMIYLGYLVLAIWFVILGWERNHLKHKINNDHVISRRRTEEDAASLSTGQRAWVGLWERLNAWLHKHEVKDDEPRASSLYTRIACIGTWALTVPVAASVVALAVEGKDSNRAVLGYKMWIAVKVLFLMSGNVYYFLDLTEGGGEGYRRYHILLPFLTGVIEAVAVAVLYSPRDGIMNYAFVVLISGCAYWASVQRGRALKRSPDARRRHVYETVVPAALATGTPLIVMSSEMAACWLRTYFKCAAEGSSDGCCMKDNRECDGVSFGASPLAWTMFLTSFHVMLYMDVKDALALANIAQLKLSALEGLQVAVFGCCAVYALVMYAMRKETAVDWSKEGLHHAAFYVAIVCSALLSSFANREKGGGGEGVGGRRSSASRDARKSMWEGGRKGAVGRGGIASASQRGGWGGKITRGASREIEVGENTLNPGFI